MPKSPMTQRPASRGMLLGLTISPSGDDDERGGAVGVVRETRQG
jgi:hypothetical protein